jgi:hypothetical protein
MATPKSGRNGEPMIGKQYKAHKDNVVDIFNNYNLNPKPHFPSVHSCVILSKNSSINYLKSS